MLVGRVYKPHFEETLQEIGAIPIVAYFCVSVNFEIQYLFDEATEGALTDTYRHF